MTQRNIDALAHEIAEENRNLMPDQATKYAEEIFKAEASEDFVLMHRLIQEALYGDPVFIK